MVVLTNYVDLNTTNCVQCSETLLSLVYSNHIRAGIILTNRINELSTALSRTLFPVPTDRGSDYKVVSRGYATQKPSSDQMGI